MSSSSPTGTFAPISKPTFNDRWNDRIAPRDDLLENGKRSGLMGGERSMRGTDHRLSIDFSGMPKGVRTAFKEGGLFKEVTLNRGRPMLMASEDS